MFMRLQSGWFLNDAASITAMELYLRVVVYFAGTLLFAAGLYAFLHESLVLAGYARSFGDGPFGIIARPIFMVGAGWFLWSFRARERKISQAIR